MSGITRKGILLCVTFYICVGLFGFLDFTNTTDDNILNNYCIRKTHDSLMTAASVFVAVAGVVAFPVNILPAQVTLKQHFLLTLLLCGSALIVALLIPGISVVFGLMGGTAASIISFILPGMFLLDEENSHPSKRKKLLALFLLWGGTLIGILSTGTTIYGLFSANDDAPLDTCSNR